MRRGRKRKMETGKIKLVAADMDGTLLNRDRKITQYTQDVIKKAARRGVYFVPATGRAVNALPEELKAMEEVRYGIFSNGATIGIIRLVETIRCNGKFQHGWTILCAKIRYGQYRLL